MTISFIIYGLLYVVNLKQLSVSHGFWDRGRGHRILTPNESFLTFRAPTSVQNFIKIKQKSDRDADRQTDRQKDASGFIICLMLCYSSGTDNKVLCMFHTTKCVILDLKMHQNAIDDRNPDSAPSNPLAGLRVGTCRERRKWEGREWKGGGWKERGGGSLNLHTAKSCACSTESNNSIVCCNFFTLH